MTPAGLVCQGFHPWSPLWKRNQSLCDALAARPWARDGLFLNPGAGWRELWSETGPYQTEIQARAARGALLPRRVAPKLRAWTPVDLLPLGRFAAVRRVNHALREVIRARLAGPPPRVVVLNDPFAPPDDTFALADTGKRVIFDLSDDFVAYRHGGDDTARERTRVQCERMARRADLVLAVNGALAERYRAVNPRTVELANACHYERFAPAARPDFPRAPAVRALAARYGTVVGYIGWMAPHRLDVPLVEELVAAHPEWGFAFAGPVDPAVREPLAAFPNAHFLGTVPHEQLPAVVAGFDVCLLPHLVNTHTAGNDPLKLYEYLAAGKPVVATPVAGVERFGNLVTRASTTGEFGDAIRTALAEPPGERVPARQAFAAANSWTARAGQVERLLFEQWS